MITSAPRYPGVGQDALHTLHQEQLLPSESSQGHACEREGRGTVPSIFIGRSLRHGSVRLR